MSATSPVRAAASLELSITIAARRMGLLLERSGVVAAHRGCEANQILHVADQPVPRHLVARAGQRPILGPGVPPRGGESTDPDRACRAGPTSSPAGAKPPIAPPPEPPRSWLGEKGNRQTPRRIYLTGENGSGRRMMLLMLETISASASPGCARSFCHSGSAPNAFHALSRPARSS